jgi:hypothetical protein
MGFLIDKNAVILCTHGGSTQIQTPNVRVKAGGGYVTTVNDLFTIAGCPFTVPGPKPQPCIKIQWLVPSARVKVNGSPVLLQNSTGICQSAEQVPQGAPKILVTQLRVKGQ